MTEDVKISVGECGECGGNRCVYENDRRAYEIRCSCPDCGHECTDFYEDLYGCMSVPWGCLL